jgi:hypothetical protein
MSRIAVFRQKGRKLLKKIGRIAIHLKLGLRSKRVAGASAPPFSVAAQTEVFPPSG